MSEQSSPTASPPDAVANQEQSLAAMIHGRAKLLLERSRNPADAENALQPKEIDELARLHQLLEIAQKTAPSPAGRRARRIALSLFVGALLTILMLMSAHCSTTEIELDVTTTDVSFAIAGPRAITPPLRATQLTVRGVQRADCPTLPELGGKVVNGGVMAMVAGDTAAQLVLGSLTPGEGSAAFSLGVADVPHQLRLELTSVAHAPGAAEITAAGAIRFTGVDGPVAFAGQTLTAVADPRRDLVFEVTLPEGYRGNLISPSLAVSALSFTGVEDESTTGHPLQVLRSGIVEGTLDVVALGNKVVKLREGEFLEAGCAVGRLRRITLEGANTRVRFHGTACDLRAGHDTYRRNLMPTWFDWLRARESVTAMWLATFWLFGLAASLVKWWRSS